jgi:hypothetical protein
MPNYYKLKGGKTVDLDAAVAAAVDKAIAKKADSVPPYLDLHKKAESSAARMIASVQAGQANGNAGLSTEQAIDAVTGPFERPGDRNRGAVDGLGKGTEPRDLDGSNPKRHEVDSVKASIQENRAPSKATTAAEAIVAANLTSPELAAASVTSAPRGLPATKHELELEGGKHVGGIDAITTQMRITRREANSKKASIAKGHWVIK